jgi:hypothetical protein
VPTSQLWLRGYPLENIDSNPDKFEHFDPQAMESYRKHIEATCDNFKVVSDAMAYSLIPAAGEEASQEALERLSPAPSAEPQVSLPMRAMLQLLLEPFPHLRPGAAAVAAMCRSMTNLQDPRSEEF